MPPIITTAGLSNSIRVQYENKYIEGQDATKLYDQFAAPLEGDMSQLKRGSSITQPFISRLAPSTQQMSETEDLVPVAYKDATVTFTPTSRGNAIKVSEKFDLTNYVENYAQNIYDLGENMMESIDLLAQSAALTGSLISRAAARASLDAGTASHRLSRTSFINAAAMLQSLRVPRFQTPRGGMWMVMVNSLALPDLLADSALLAVGQYQDASLIMNGEIGELMGFKILAHPDAKVFYAAGAANASAVNTTLSAEVDELATTITVASATNVAVGQWLMIGTAETANTHYATNERVQVAAIDSTTLTVVGQGVNGGLRFAHAAGVAVKNADNVVPAVWGGPESLAKGFDPEVGETGQIVGPKKTGLADQWTTVAWKFYGGYGIIAQNRILRTEHSLGLDA